jgi:hypothetical protein
VTVRPTVRRGGGGAASTVGGRRAGSEGVVCWE